MESTENKNLHSAEEVETENSCSDKAEEVVDKVLNSVSDGSGTIKICEPDTQNTSSPRNFLRPSSIAADISKLTTRESSQSSFSLSPSKLSNPFLKCITKDVPSKVEDVKSKEPVEDEKDASVDNHKSDSESLEPKAEPASVTSPSSILESQSSDSQSSSLGFVSSGESSGLSASPLASTMSAVSSGFVFGENLKEKVATKEDAPSLNGFLSSEDNLFSSAIQKDKATSISKENEKTCETGEVKTLSEAAKEYEESRMIKRKYEEVTIFTGEEEETNALKINNCKLFSFDNNTSNWVEKGRGALKLNDKGSDDNYSSRIIIRVAGSHRVILNAKVWDGMKVERASNKSIRLTAVEDNQPKIYLIMASQKDSDELENLLKSRIYMKKQKVESNNEDSS